MEGLAMQLTSRFGGPPTIRRADLNPRVWKDRFDRLDEAGLERLIKRLGIGIVVGTLVFGGFYFLDRHVDPGPSLAERGVASLEDQVRATPNDLALRMQLAAAYIAVDREADALTQVNEVINAEPSAIAYLVRGDILYRQQALDAAGADYQRVIDAKASGEFAMVDTQLARAFVGLGRVFLDLGKAADAAPLLLNAVRIEQTNADNLALYGRALFESGNPEGAIGPLRQAVAFVPTEWADPYVTLAAAYAKLGKTDEAAWATAMADFADQQPGKAEEALQALTGGAAAVDAYVGLGLIATSLGDREAAATAYSAALAIDPTNFLASTGLSTVTEPDNSPSAAPSNGGTN